MSVVLGIDAAWTAGKPSGVALICKSNNRWRCVAVEPTYEHFIQRAGLSDAACAEPRPALLLRAAERLLDGTQITVVAVDMPMSRRPIDGRRSADDQLSCKFGAQACGTHSPSRLRPGRIGTAMSDGWCGLGYELAVSGKMKLHRVLIEVYPHPALLVLLNASRRIQYKVSKTSRYWPGTPVHYRVQRLLEEMQKILVGLRSQIRNIDLTLPQPGDVSTLSQLKSYEDMLDALVCCWVGAKFLAQQAEAFGDDHAAIWVPQPHRPRLVVRQR